MNNKEIRRLIKVSQSMLNDVVNGLANITYDIFTKGGTKRSKEEYNKFINLSLEDEPLILLFYDEITDRIFSKRITSINVNKVTPRDNDNILHQLNFNLRLKIKEELDIEPVIPEEERLVWFYDLVRGFAICRGETIASINDLFEQSDLNTITVKDEVSFKDYCLITNLMSCLVVISEFILNELDDNAKLTRGDFVYCEYTDIIWASLAMTDSGQRLLQYLFYNDEYETGSILTKLTTRFYMDFHYRSYLINEEIEMINKSKKFDDISSIVVLDHDINPTISFTELGLLEVSDIKE